jgi:cytochrome P450
MNPDQPTLSLTQLLEPELLNDPAPFYHRLREEAPAYFDPTLGSWLLSRYGDVWAALQNPLFSSERVMANLERQPPEVRDKVRPIYQAIAKQIMYSDPPAHTRLRGLVARAFAPRALESFRPRLQEAVESMLDEAIARADGFDVARDLAYPLPMRIIIDLLGVPRADHTQFKKWSVDLSGFIASARMNPEQAARAVQGIGEFIEYFRALVAQRRRQPPRLDLLGLMMSAEGDGSAGLDEDELLANSVFLLAAGHETTSNLICNAVLTLLRHPEQLSSLRATPQLLDSAIEEVLRYEVATRWTSRILKEDIELHGQVLRKGQSVLLMLAAANRDPRRFPNPDRFDISRTDNRHLGFGQGPHFCVGAGLARLEMRTALSCLLRRFPKLRLPAQADGHRAPQWIPSVFFRGLSSLPVKISGEDDTY